MAKTLLLNSSFSLLSFPLVALGLGALLAIGCGNAGAGLADAARGISKRASQSSDSGSAGAGAEDMNQVADEEQVDEALAETDDGGTAADPTPSAAAASDEHKPMAPVSDDSVRCGDGKLDIDELCDVAIPKGKTGACPSECEPLDACHAAKLDVHGCWSQCVLGAEIPCE